MDKDVHNSAKILGWNTYDARGLNRIIKFPQMYQIRISLFTPQDKRYTSQFYFLEHLSDLGNVLKVTHHNLSCRYASCTLSFSGCIFKIEYVHPVREPILSKDNAKLICKISPVSISDSLSLILVEVTKIWGEKGGVELKEGKIFAENLIINSFYDFHSVYHQGKPVTFGVFNDEEEIKNSLVLKGELNNKEGRGEIAVLGFYARLPLKILANIEEKIDLDKEIEIVRKEVEDEIPKIIGGPFDKASQILTTCINWCVVYDKINDRPYTPVCRSWINEYSVRMGFNPDAKGPMIAVWDNLFNALLHSVEDKILAEENIRCVLDDYSLCEEGYPPNYVLSGFKSEDRSQPPLGSLVVWKVYRKYKNFDFLRWVYPRLKRWHKWWFERRDGNKDGLLEYGSTFGVKNPGNDPWCVFAAACESGMDNSPLYDEAVYDKNTSCLNLIDIGLNSLITADALYLSKIARELGFREEAEEFLEEHQILKEKINKELFDEKDKIYRDKFWDGSFSSHLAPTCFYPFLAKIPSYDLAKEMVQNYLLNEEKFWGEYVIPSISKDDPAFKEQLYWRGRIWPSMNYLVYLGLKEYEFEDVSFEFAKKSFALFLKEWEINSHCHENYNAITGWGCDVPIREKQFSLGSDRFYSWGVLLCLMGLEELIDVEWEDGIRFGCNFTQGLAVSNIKLENSVYSLKIDKDRLTGKRDGKIFYESRPKTQVRNYIKEKNKISFKVKGRGITEFKIYEFPKGSSVEIRVNKKRKMKKVGERGELKFKEDLKDEYQDIKILRIS